MDKSLFFLFLSFLFIWLILDQFYGRRIVGNFVDTILGLDQGGGAAAGGVATQNIWADADRAHKAGSL